MEDAFIILFFTFVSQQIHTLRGGHKATPTPHGRTPSGTDHTPSSPNSMFPWLQVDVQSEEARDFFPSEVVKSVVPNPNDPATLRLSMLLEAFQQFLRAFENMKKENASLQRRGRLYDEMSRKYKALEAKMSQMQAATAAGSVGSQGVWQGRGQEDHRKDDLIADLKEQLKQVKCSHKFGAISANKKWMDIFCCYFNVPLIHFRICLVVSTE